MKLAGESFRHVTHDSCTLWLPGSCCTGRNYRLWVKAEAKRPPHWVAGTDLPGQEQMDVARPWTSPQSSERSAFPVRMKSHPVLAGPGGLCYARQSSTRPLPKSLDERCCRPLHLWLRMAFQRATSNQWLDLGAGPGI